MVSFYNVETKEPVNVMYFASSQKGAVVLKVGGPKPGMMSFRTRPQVVVANGGQCEPVSPLDPKPGEYYWKFTGLTRGSEIIALDGDSKQLAKIPCQPVSDLDSYKWVQARFSRRGMQIDLDQHIDYVCYGSKIGGEGIAFRPKNAAAFKQEIEDTQLFHHDDRSDPFGAAAASATIGEGYREVSTPSLHVAIDQTVSSVHVDSYAFLLRGPNGDVVIGPDVGQHIFDELLFRMPMAWLRRKKLPFLASVLQTLHPVLPNSTNRYSPALGMRIELGASQTADLRAGMPRFTFESTYNFGSNTDRRFHHEATLRLLANGNPDRSPDIVLSLKGQVDCRDIRCRDHQENVGLFLTINR